MAASTATAPVPRSSSGSLSPAVSSASWRRRQHDKQHCFSVGGARQLGMLERAVLSAHDEVLWTFCVYGFDGRGNGACLGPRGELLLC